MSNMKTVFKIYKEIHSLEKKVLPSVTVQSIVSSLKPFINILFTAKIINLLSDGKDFKTVMLYITIAVAINFILFFLDSFLDEYSQNLRNLLLNKENKKVASKLFRTEYQKLENSEYKELIHKHEEAEKSRWSRFPYFVWTTYRFLNGLFTLIISVIIIFPLLKVGFTKTGDTFFEKPIFLITIISAILAMAVIILLVAVNINKSYLKANESYAELDRIFYSFLDIFGDYRTGKEIRIYKEQNLIDSIATSKILTDGEKTLRKISMHTAKASSFVAILGAVVGFGVYLFIGIKGLLGLFSIGSLVLYCGSFMQIINGIMMMANTFGKLQEIIPLAKRYFEILDTKDEMTYGNKVLDLSGVFEIEFKNVSFKYPGAENYALQNVNLKIKNGEHLAVVGRNGSGKTTLLRCITKIEKLNGGGITYSDGVKETNDYLTHIGYLPQNFEIFNELTAYEVLQFFANLKDYGITDDEINNLLKSLNLFSKKDTVVKKLSGGMKRRLGIAQALIGNPDIVLLDEPTAGLDPEERLNFKNVVREIKKDRCVVLSTHIITDIESLCDKILILSNGVITQFNSCDELANVANGKVFAVNSTDNIDAPFYSMGTIYIDGKTYEKVICLNKIDALPLAPTVEDGYICFIENLNLKNTNTF